VWRQTINAIETRRYLPSFRLAFAIARSFGAPVEEISTGNVSPEMRVPGAARQGRREPE
jgi:DNA-binding XRE family transcriptional regulator